MDKCPAVGQRVRFVGNLVIGPCTGVVKHIYPSYQWEGDIRGAVIPADRLCPESEWHVRLLVDEIPAEWCYRKDGIFSPLVSELELL